MEILRTITDHCFRSPQQPIDGILYLHRITDLRFSGKDMLRLHLLQALCGPDFYPHITIVSTMWNRIPNDGVKNECDRRLTELLDSPRHWGGLMGSLSGKGGNHFAFLGDRESALAVMSHVREAGHHKISPQIVQELDSGTPLEKTAAAEIIVRERRKREEKMRQNIEEEKAELEAETREAERLREMQKRPRPATGRSLKALASRCHKFPRRDSETRAPDLEHHEDLAQEARPTPGRCDKHEQHDRHVTHFHGRRGSEVNISALGLNFNFNISRQK